MHRLARRAFALAGLLLVAACAQSDSPARVNAQQLVDNAAYTVERFKTAPDLKGYAAHIGKAKAVVVFPQVVKAGFLFGGEGGNGVLVARGKDGGWGSPAFYTLGAASFGLQIGLQDTEVVLVVRSQGALDAILEDQAKLGADAGITVGVHGVGVEAATTTNVGPDVLAFANARLGGFVGASLEGAVIARRRDFNEAYYGAGATPRAIVQGRHANPGADRLRAALGK